MEVKRENEKQDGEWTRKRKEESRMTGKEEDLGRKSFSAV